MALVAASWVARRPETDDAQAPAPAPAVDTAATTVMRKPDDGGEGA